MTRLIKIAALAALLILSIVITGCTVARVEVNAYSEGRTKLAPGQNLTLALAPAGPPTNPLLDREIAAKLAKTLQGLGHRIAENTDLVMTYEYGVGPAQQRSRLEPVRVFGGYDYIGYTGSDGKRHYRPVPRDDFMRYETVYYTVYPKRLWLGLLKYGDNTTETLWAVDATLLAHSADLRKDIDYLIVAGLEKLGQDTGQAVSVDLSFGDERVKRLRGK